MQGGEEGHRGALDKSKMHTKVEEQELLQLERDVISAY